MALSTTGLVVTAALVAGAAGAGAAAAVLGTSRPPVPSPAADPARIAALEDRLARQDREIVELRARVEEAAHERAASLPPRAGPVGGPGDAPGGALEARRPGVDGAPSPESLATLSPEERERFESVYRDLREKDQERSRKTRQAAFEAQLRSRLDRLPAEVALTPEQKDAAVRILVERGDRIRAAFEEARATGGPDAMRVAQEKAEAARQEARLSLQQSLTVDQVRAVEGAGDRDGGTPRGNRLGVRRADPGAGPGGGRRRPDREGGEPAPAPVPPPR